MIARASQGFKAAETKEALCCCTASNTYAMHVLSGIGGTREERLCILSAVLLWGVVAWLFTVRAARGEYQQLSYKRQQPRSASARRRAEARDPVARAPRESPGRLTTS